MGWKRQLPCKVCTNIYFGHVGDKCPVCDTREKMVAMMMIMSSGIKMSDRAAFDFGKMCAELNVKMEVEEK